MSKARKSTLVYRLYTDDNLLFSQIVSYPSHLHIECRILHASNALFSPVFRNKDTDDIFVSYPLHVYSKCGLLHASNAVFPQVVVRGDSKHKTLYTSDVIRLRTNHKELQKENPFLCESLVFFVGLRRSGFILNI